MTDDTTETTDMSDNETASDGTGTDPVDLLPVGDTDVLAEVAEADDESDTGSEVAEEVAAMHIESDETQVAEELGNDDDSEIVTDDPTMRPGKWYVVHTQSGYEKKVTANLEARIQSMNMEDRIYEIVIPMENYWQNHKFVLQYVLVLSVHDKWHKLLP